MGLVMVVAARNPMAHKSLIDFLITANLAHALTMVLFAQSLWHILDVLTIGGLGGILLFIYPWGLRRFMSY